MNKSTALTSKGIITSHLSMGRNQHVRLGVVIPSQPIGAGADKHPRLLQRYLVQEWILIVPLH